MVADGLLILLPTLAIRHLKNESSLRRRLAFIFAASVVTTTVSFTGTMLNLFDVGFGVFVAAEMEVRIAHHLRYLNYQLIPIYQFSAGYLYSSATLVSS